MEDGAPVTLTRRGLPVAVLLSAREYSRLAESRPDFIAALAAFRARQPDLDGVADALDGTREPFPRA